jgi:hypothetical protein
VSFVGPRISKSRRVQFSGVRQMPIQRRMRARSSAGCGRIWRKNSLYLGLVAASSAAYVVVPPHVPLLRHRCVHADLDAPFAAQVGAFGLADPRQPAPALQQVVDDGADLPVFSGEVAMQLRVLPGPKTAEKGGEAPCAPTQKPHTESIFIEER